MADLTEQEHDELHRLRAEVARLRAGSGLAVLASDQFAQVWDAANRVAHDELDAVLTTGHGRFPAVGEDTLYLDLGGIITAVKQRLVGAGLTLVQRLPDFPVTVPLVASGDRVASEMRGSRTAGWPR